MYDTTFCYKTRKCFSCDVTGLARATNKVVWCTAAGLVQNLDSGLDSWTGLWTDIWTGFWTDTAMGDDHFQP